jgi:DNA-binding response OmpR family regulator
VVDEDAQVRQAVRWAQEDEGLAVVTAADGHEALGLAVERRPDLVVLDLTLPEMNGYAWRAACAPGTLGRFHSC